MSKAIIVSGWLCCIACATGSSGDTANVQQDAAVTQHDASNVATADAARSDSGVVGQDAQVSQTVDAGTGSGSGPFCSTNSECTVSGECCVTLGGPSGFCAPGTVFLGECFPE